MAIIPPGGRWQLAAAPSPRLRAVLSAIHRYTQFLLDRYPLVAVPGTGISGHLTSGPFTVRALTGLWSVRAEWFAGGCPACGEPARGYRALATHTTGTIAGCCLTCGVGVERRVGDLAVMWSLVSAEFRTETMRHDWPEVPDPLPPRRETPRRRAGRHDLTLIHCARDEAARDAERERLRWRPIEMILGGLHVKLPAANAVEVCDA